MILYIIRQTIILLCCLTISADHDSRTPTFIYSNNALLGLHGKAISIQLENREIGIIRYLKIPFFKMFVLYDFYILPEFRKQGYGLMLGYEALQNIQELKPTYIFAQPGPFELHQARSQQALLSPEEASLQLNRLVECYKKAGFKVNKNVWLTRFLYILYSVLRINENPRLFMVYDCHEHAQDPGHV